MATPNDENSEADNNQVSDELSEEVNEPKESKEPTESNESKESKPASFLRPEITDYIQQKFQESEQNELNGSVGALDKRRSFRPKAKHTIGTREYDLHEQIQASITKGLDTKEYVCLPEGYVLDEWISVHVIDFYNEINLLYGTISALCTNETCPEMNAGPCYSYLWAEPNSKPSIVSAPQYLHRLTHWIENQINDSSVFPTNNAHFSVEFRNTAKTILRRLFRVYAHMYHSHFEDFRMLKADADLNFCFKRFIYFVLEYDLIQKKELNALRKLISTFAGMENTVESKKYCKETIE